MQPAVGVKSSRATCRKIAARHDRIGVVADHDDEVIERLGHPHHLVARRIGQLHKPVVIGVGGIVDPAIIRLQGGHREAALGTRDPVGPVEAVEQRKRALRACAVAFALVGPYAAAAADGARLAARPGEPPRCITQRHRRCPRWSRIGHGRHYNGRQQKRSPR
jgi:hypothetical protein